MQPLTAIRAPDISTTLPLACLLSSASAHPSISTGKERDSESGNDYFEARYYSSTMGRFMSPDWSAKEDPVPYANLENPQTLNLYSYVQNNPLLKPDLDGHGCPPDWRVAHPVFFIANQSQHRGCPILRVLCEGWVGESGLAKYRPLRGQNPP
jgi:RHS repeat-associated protein